MKKLWVKFWMLFDYNAILVMVFVAAFGVIFLTTLATSTRASTAAASNHSAVASPCDQVKIFGRFDLNESLEKNRGILEADVNRWLKENAGKIEVVRIQTLATGIAQSFLEIIVWYKQKAD